MPERRRNPADAEARRRLAQQMREAGQKVRAARRRRNWTQNGLGGRIGVHQSAISRLELGEGASLSVLVWQRTAMSLDLPLKVEIGRDFKQAPADAGHLDIQELLLRLGRQTGRVRRFELPNRAGNPTRWTDVGLRDDRLRCLIQLECVNVLDDFGAAMRSSDRKLADAEQVVIATGHGRPFTVHQCWVVRATRRNRELVTRYPQIFAARFTGSSRAWLKALTVGGRPPDERGLVWCDVGATKLVEWRRPT